MRQRVGGQVGDVPWLTKNSGLAALQLSSTATGVEGLHDVEVSQTPHFCPACQVFVHLLLSSVLHVCEGPRNKAPVL